MKGETVRFDDHQFVPGAVFQLHCCLAGYFSEGCRKQVYLYKLKGYRAPKTVHAISEVLTGGGKRY